MLEIIEVKNKFTAFERRIQPTPRQNKKPPNKFSPVSLLVQPDLSDHIQIWYHYRIIIICFLK